MTAGGPSKVMIIRHGEKLGDPSKDDDSGKHLSIQGSARAAYLPSLFVPPTQPNPPAPPTLECKLAVSGTTFSASYESKDVAGNSARFATPDFIIATASSKHSDRPVDTITPTAAALNLPINSSYSNSASDIQQLAKDVLSTSPKSPYAGKVVLICWHHGTIETLATALKGTGAQKWVGTVFDRVWLLDYSQSSTPPIQQFGQELLFTDETNVPTTPW